MKKKVKEYYINGDGKLIEVEDIKESTNNHSTNVVSNVESVKEASSDIRPAFLVHQSVISQNEFNEDSKLLSNPFFYDYNPNVVDNIHQIHTIEDYYIQRGKKLYNFGGLVRNDAMWLSKRRRILRNQMKVWKQEYTKRLSDLSVFGSSEFQTYERKIAKGVNIIFPLIAFVTIVACFILINGRVWIITKPSPHWCLMATYTCMISSFFTLLMSVLINRSVASIKSLYSVNKLEYKKKKAELEREFQKKYTYTYNYYVKGIRHGFKKPVILLDKTAVGEAKIKQLELLITENSKKLQGNYRLDRSLAIPKIILNAATVLTFLYVLIYVLYEIAIYFIRK